MNATKVRASEMLAALSANRFLLYPEKEFIALGVPYELRRSTQDTALRERAKRPFNPKHMPIMTRNASEYVDTLRLARSISSSSNDFRKKNFKKVKAYVEAESARGYFDPPAAGAGLYESWQRHGRQIQDWVYSLQSAWDKLTSLEKLWFEDMPPVVRWAWDFPSLAPIPHRFYPTEETPERERQKILLRWVLEQ